MFTKIEDDAINGVFTITSTLVQRVTEEQDRFIFETISPYLTECTKQVIPKRLLIRALTTFMQEHKEEYIALMGECNNE